MMKSVNIFDLGHRGLIAINPDHVRYVKSATEGTQVHFNDTDWIFIGEPVESVSLALWGTTVGPGKDKP